MRIDKTFPSCITSALKDRINHTVLKKQCSDLKAEGIRSCCWWCEEKLHDPGASSHFPADQLSPLESGRSHPPKSFPPESDGKTLKHRTKVKHYFTDFRSKRTLPITLHKQVV